MSLTRREFIKRITSSLWGTALAHHYLSMPEAQARASYKLHHWTGDNFKIGHRLRDGKLPKLPKHAEKKVDVVILGGGLSGLATAYLLQDREFLLLEQYDDLGGQSRGSSFRGIDYSYAAAYYTDDVGNLAKLVDKLGLKPAKLEAGKNAWYWQDHFLDKNDKKHVFFKELKRLEQEVERLSNKVGDSMLTSFKADSSLRKLDKIKFSDMLKGYDPGFVALLDSYLKSSLCGGNKRVSALAALYLMADLFIPSYVLPGGNTAIAKALISCLKSSSADSLRTNTFVWNVELTSDGASVIYQDGKKRLHKIDAEHVVVAIPHLVSSRIIRNLDDQTKSNLFRFRYGSYLVANLLLNKQVYDRAYDSWFSNPFDFADITLADMPYMKKESRKRKDASVLTIYQPYEPASIGRTLLFKGDRKSIAKAVVKQTNQIIPAVNESLEEVVLSRWGHALAVPIPKFYQRIEFLQAQEKSNYSFAHSSSQGLPSAEAAIDAAVRVANKLNGKTVSQSNRFYSISGRKELEMNEVRMG